MALPFAVILGLGGLTACGDTAGSEEGADVEDVQDEDLWGDTDEFVGDKITVSAEVNEVLNNRAFTIVGTDDSDGDPLLVVSANQVKNLNEGSGVEVTGIVHERFFLEDVEEDFGVDWDVDVFDDWEEQNYIEAKKVDTSLEQDNDN